MKNERNEKNEESIQDDPRLTAYALGELEESEAAEVEALLAGDEAARRTVADVRRLGERLRAELGSEASGNTIGALTDSQRDAIRRRVQDPVAGGRPRRWRVAGWSGAIAASLALVALALNRWSVGSWDALPAAVSVPEIEESASADPGLSLSLAGGQSLRGLGYNGIAASPAPSRPSMDIRGGYDFDLLQLKVEVNGAVEHAAEAYALIVDNAFELVRDDPLSTFSIDVDTASYANVRRFLNQGRLPPKDAVRIEELVNYFVYAYPPPTGNDPFSVSVETASCPWKPQHRLVRIGLKGREIAPYEAKRRNLVVLIDVSGSMNNPDKLPLLKRSMRLLVENLDERDTVAIVVYASREGLALPATSCGRKAEILASIDLLAPGGSTHGSAGIQLAYRIASENFVEGGINRVILATDGDFNVGITDQGALIRTIEDMAKKRVFLSVLGFGTGNLKDATMEQLADHGNGNYSYIDSLHEARKVLVRQMGATLETIAKDVKVQVEFNPGKVNAFRLIGYENRVLAHRDFNDDTKDAGEIGAGHTVTALYEVVPAGVPVDVPGVDPLKYQTPAGISAAAMSGELLTVKLRYKQPEGDTSRLIEVPVRDEGGSWAESSVDLQWASAVAAFGMVLRDSPYKGDLSLELALELAFGAAGPDPFGYRAEFLRLVEQAMQLSALQGDR
ncbi:MAG: VWA domain-containing protein [Planctomycetota bacterium]|nr:VWA domain-containing protein [Planctomycetota bacterium]